MKKIFSISNIFFLLLLAFVVYRQFPTIKSNFENEGKLIKGIKVYSSMTSSMIDYPTKQKTVLIFWASWCMPCKIEMNRIQSMIDDKKIESRKVFAINSFESQKVIKKFIKKNNYSFNYIMDPTNNLSREFKIQSTPTIVFFDGNKVKNVTSGIGPLLTFKINRHFN